MLALKQIKEVNWIKILSFYGIILLGTYIARKLPNLLNLIFIEITGTAFPFNFNHGIVTLITALVFYRFSGVKQEITLLGNNKFKSLLFPIVLFTCYSFYGINNSYGINPHIWALIFCFQSFVYNIMEEYAWRGYLIDGLAKINYILKSVVSGIFWAVWHLFIFNDFNQYGGFWVFLAFCIVFSFVLTFAVLRTKSIVVAAAFHGFIIRTNIVAVICFSIFMLLLLTWRVRLFQKRHN